MKTGKRRLMWSFCGAVFALLVVGASVLVASPTLFTKSFFGASRMWREHWPITRGAGVPITVGRVLERHVDMVPIWFESEPNLVLYLDPKDYVPRFILDHGIWDPKTWNAINRHLPRGGTLIDVGAHIGYYSLKGNLAMGPESRVIAIEPNPVTLKVLQANIERNHATNITVEPVACSDREGTLEFFASWRINTARSSLSNVNAGGPEGKVVEKFMVRARPLDDIVSELHLDRVDVIKIDVEGAEWSVLQGAKQTIARFHPALIVEDIEEHLEQMGSSNSRIEQFLESYGYTARKLDTEPSIDWVYDPSKRSAK